MKEKQNKIDRRNFLKTMAAATVGLTNVFAPTQAKAAPNKQQPKFPQVTKRKLGKTGVEVPCLAIGTNKLLNNQIILKNSIQWGVGYWDTGNDYTGGNSEICIGKYIAKNEEVRKVLFIASKASDAKTAEDVEKRLQTSLKRMNVKYIDLYYGVHRLSEPEQLTDELKEWVKTARF